MKNYEILDGLQREAQGMLKNAYDKGYKRGHEDGLALNQSDVNAAEACGMRRAWDVARKILSRHGEGYNATDKEVFGTDDVFSLSAFEAVSKLEAWEKKQDAPDGNIEVGDEVRMIGSDPKLDNCDYGVCTMVKPKTIYVMRMDGSVGEEDKEEWKKTGNHYNIKDILDKMKEHEAEE